MVREDNLIIHGKFIFVLLIKSWEKIGVGADPIH